MSEFIKDGSLAPNDTIIEWCHQLDQQLAEYKTADWRAQPRSQQYNDLEALVGHTPLMEVPEVPGVFAKLEYTNPSGCHYDRASVATLRSLESSGFIRPGDELRDITSGSGGISLALFGKLLGYRVRISLPNELPASRVYPMEHFGAEVVRTGLGYVQAMSDFQADEIRAFKALTLEDDNRTLQRAPDYPATKSFLFEDNATGERICYLNHSENQVTPSAYRALASEMITQTLDPPAAVMLAVGNWTSIAGIAPELRSVWPDTNIVGVRPADDNDQRNFGLTLSGLTIPFRFRDDSLLDQVVDVTNFDRENMRQRINAARPEADKLGNSSLLCLVAAEAIAAASGGHVITIAYDQAMRY